MLRSSWLNRVFLTDKIYSQNKDSDVENKFIEKDENELLFNEVVALPPVFKDVIILFYYHGYNTKEISEILNVVEGTVRSRLHRARGMLKERLEGRLEYSE